MSAVRRWTCPMRVPGSIDSIDPEGIGARILPMLRYQLLDRSLRHLPDPVLRTGSKLATRNRLARERDHGIGTLVRHMSSGPVAELPEKTNEQHYELPAEFFALFLGPRRKYS